MIINIYGEDTFRSRQYLKKTIEQFKKQRDPQGYNVVVLDAKKEKPGKILSEMASAPFLAERRMVVLENVLSISDKDFLADLIEKIKEKKLSESNVLVFWQGETLGKVKEIKELAKLLEKEKFSQEFKLLEGTELFSWTKKEIENRGGKIGEHALQYLCQNVNKDIWLLNSLIDQLVAYAHSVILRESDGRSKDLLESEHEEAFRSAQNNNMKNNNKNLKEIMTADIQLFLEEKGDDNIFNLVDAVVGGNKKLAYKLIRDQLESGEDYQFIHIMIVRQFKILLEMRDLFDREDGLTSDMIAKRLELHPFVIRKSMSLVKMFSMQKLRDIYNDLLQIDIKTKTGRGDQSLLIDLFVEKTG
ncbi:hypothetical protein KKC87_00885 [Patescibacteria group bacterium]|nr:hypothetical protein [Patescibacteria group bacterium]